MTSRLLHSQDFAISVHFELIRLWRAISVSMSLCLSSPFPHPRNRQSTFPFKDFSPSVLSDSHRCLSSSSLSLPPSQSIPFQSPFFSPFSIFSPLLIVTHHPLSLLSCPCHTDTDTHSLHANTGRSSFSTPLTFRMHSDALPFTRSIYSASPFYRFIFTCLFLHFPSAFPFLLIVSAQQPADESSPIFNRIRSSFSLP